MVSVFIVDDSAVMRQVMGLAVSHAHKLTLAGSAPDPIIAYRKMKANWPDVILLDIDMPKMDGITFLKKIMSERPTPIVIYTGVTHRNATQGIEALASGAIDVIAKPQSSLSEFLSSEGVGVLLASLESAAYTKVKPLKYLAEESIRQTKSVDLVVKPEFESAAVQQQRIIAIGASTGGTEAVEYLLKHIGPNSAPIVVVQHMPEAFTPAFAQRLNASTKHTVIHADNDQPLRPGHVYIAQGGKHLMIYPSRSNQSSDCDYRLEIVDGPMINRHRPSVDVLFRSVAQAAGKHGIGIILTGMGDDGAQGMLDLHHVGGVTYAEAESSCVVFGMPKAAIEKGGVQNVYSLQSLPYQLKKQWVE